MLTECPSAQINTLLQHVPLLSPFSPLVSSLFSPLSLLQINMPAWVFCALFSLFPPPFSPSSHSLLTSRCNLTWSVPGTHSRASAGRSASWRRILCQRWRRPPRSCRFALLALPCASAAILPKTGAFIRGSAVHRQHAGGPLQLPSLSGETLLLQLRWKHAVALERVAGSQDHGNERRTRVINSRRLSFAVFTAFPCYFHCLSSCFTLPSLVAFHCLPCCLSLPSLIVCHCLSLLLFTAFPFCLSVAKIMTALNRGGGGGKIRAEQAAGADCCWRRRRRQ